MDPCNDPFVLEQLELELSLVVGAKVDFPEYLEDDSNKNFIP